MTCNIWLFILLLYLLILCCSLILVGSLFSVAPFFFFFSFYHLGPPTTSIFKGTSFFFCRSFDFSRTPSLVPCVFQALYLWLTGSQWPNLTGFPLERGRRCLKVNSNRYYLCPVTLWPLQSSLALSSHQTLSIWMGSGANLSGFECLFSLLTNNWTLSYFKWEI